jgi:hypothetical protein
MLLPNNAHSTRLSLCKGTTDMGTLLARLAAELFGFPHSQAGSYDFQACFPGR